ncbi:ATP-binding cassette domain-containing protein [candidate division CSSED10-310 bacterium]|uniref:ATP-binding cassette domain-containing protein n=1 Tax=candidate division CSSED10-310 bacterium TaxID=2855610 RepID=A0ABV6Z0V9_UNCC1
MNSLRSISWSDHQLGEAIEALSTRSGLIKHALKSEVPAYPSEISRGSSDFSGKWIATIASSLGIEAEEVDTAYSDIEQFIRKASPALIRITDEKEDYYLALLSSRNHSASILGSDRKIYRTTISQIRNDLCRNLEGKYRNLIDHLMLKSEIPEKQREKVRSGLNREILGPARIHDCWILRMSPGSNFWHQLMQKRMLNRIVSFSLAHVILYILLIVSWWLIGKSALQGRFDPGIILAWALVLFSQIPFRLVAHYSQNLFTVELGGTLKLRLLYGALKFKPDDIRHQGSGKLLGRVMESEAVEALVLSGGLMGMVAIIEIIAAAWVLSLGVSSYVLPSLFGGWLVFSLWIGFFYFRRRDRWTQFRLKMTNNLVEKMIGHRTRLVQELPEHIHDGEDQEIVNYLELSHAIDNYAIILSTLLTRGWLILGIIGLAPAFIFTMSSSSAIAITLGGILLASRALHKLATSFSQLTGAAIAWQQVSPLFFAATHSDYAKSPEALIPNPSLPNSKQPLLVAHDLVFKYREGSLPVLDRCSLDIKHGERILLEGPSGCGKSTLVSLLVGIRHPSNGLILINGFDYQTLGRDGWCQHVVVAPQFHENHILTETFAFNLLMGRGWPPLPADLQQAEKLCHELGLGDLLNRMPAGMMQMIGETGWQLSHGEKSRLYIARALLQGADLVIFDESFAALDPITLQQAVKCVLNHAPTLLVIAHP